MNDKYSKMRRQIKPIMMITVNTVNTILVTIHAVGDIDYVGLDSEWDDLNTLHIITYSTYNPYTTHNASHTANTSYLYSQYKQPPPNTTDITIISPLAIPVQPQPIATPTNTDISNDSAAHITTALLIRLNRCSALSLGYM